MVRRIDKKEFFEPLRERLSIAKNAIETAHNSTSKAISSHLNTQFQTIDELLHQITSAFLAIENWKTSAVEEFEEIIRTTNKFVPDPTVSDHDYQLFPFVTKRLNDIKRQLQNNFRPLVSDCFEPAKNRSESVDQKKDTQEEEKRNKQEWDQKILFARESYNRLPEKLQSCFLWLSIFPEGCIIKRRSLIYWWIGEGLVEPTGDKTAEQVGEDSFAKLLECSLIEPLHNQGKQRTVVQSCTLHPLIRSMAISMARQNRLFAFDTEERPTAWSSTGECPSRACITSTEENQVVSISPPHIVTSVSLFNLNAHYVNFKKDASSKLTNLTVLQLGRWQSIPEHHIEIVNVPIFLECLLNLKSLRYLGLRGISELKELPDGIGELSNLRVLDLQSCHDLQRLPSAISGLKKLTHLDLSQCYMLQCVPFDVTNLELQVAKGLLLGYFGHYPYLTSLEEWKGLRKLSLDICNKVKIEEREFSSVKNLINLRSITITWWNRGEFKNSGWKMDWLPESLEKLDLRCAPMEEAPSGLVPRKLKNLKRLYLRGGMLRSLKGLVKEGFRWQVESLRLRYLNKLELLNRLDVREAFPCLKYAEIEQCPKFTPVPGNEWDMIKSVRDQQSYDELDLQLKSCFLSLSIFPKGFEVKRTKLIHWWIGEGLVEQMGGRTAEQVGKDYFKKLVESGLIEPIYKKGSRIDNSCRLHPVVRGLAITIAKETRFFAFNSEGCPTAWSDECSSRACLMEIEDQTVNVSPPSNMDELVSLINLNVRNVTSDMDVASKMKNLTVLHLGRWSTSPRRQIIANITTLIESLHLLKCLRYLGLQGIRGIKEIPDSISELLDLRVLDLQECEDIVSLSSEVIQLRKLTHLDVSLCNLLEYMPCKINDLEELQVMKGFVMGNSTIEHRGDLSNLGRWVNLRKLCLEFWDKVEISESDLSGVKHLISLRSLTITWNTVFWVFRQRSTTNLEWLPSNLEKLDLRSFPLPQISFSIDSQQRLSRLHNLKKLYIRGGDLCTLEGLLELSSDWKVEILRLRHLREFETHWSDICLMFPFIRHAEIVACPKVTSFPGNRQKVWTKLDAPPATTPQT